MNKSDKASLLLVTGLLFELVSLSIFTAGNSDGMALIIHLLAVGIVVWAVYESNFVAAGLRIANALGLGFSVTIALLPVFGPLLLVGYVLLWRRTSSQASAANFIGFEDVYHGDEAKHVHMNREEIDILSIIRGSSKEQRRRAILSVRTFEPVAGVPVLQRCLQDSDELVRIYAQGILQNLVENLEGQIRSIRARLETEKEPERRIQLHLDLAEALHEQVYIGLAEEEQVRQSLLDMSCAEIHHALEIAPQRMDIHFINLRYLLEARKVEAAQSELETLESAGFDTFLLLPLKCELAFLNRQWGSLVQRCGEAENTGMAYGRMVRSCALWKEAG